MNYTDLLKKYKGVDIYMAEEVYYKITDLNKIKIGILSTLQELVIILVILLSLVDF